MERINRKEENQTEELTGIFISNAKGFGFVEVEGRDEDLYIPGSETNGAFHGDTVQVEILKSGCGRREEAGVTKILKRGFTTIVGTYERTNKHYGFVTPDNRKFPQDIYVPAERAGKAVSGHKVVVQITDYGKPGHDPEGKIIEILGHTGDPGIDIMAMVRAYELPCEFPEKALRQAEKLAIDVDAKSLAGRKDLRELVTITIDGEDAKDLDDAVSIAFDGEFYHLGVHIADVSDYVRENSVLDREAKKRGTSVYLTDRVIPMLPHVLSNGICSLNAGEDRLTLSCLMKIDADGEFVDYEICESAIRVRKRMTYTAVQKLIEDGSLTETDGEFFQYRELLDDLRQMRKLADILRAKRRRRGSVNFDFPECKITLDSEGHPTQICACERNAATGIIEEFMLAANETVAQHFYWLDIPFVYRVHDVPDEERIRRLTLFIQNFGYYMKSMDKRGSKLGSGEIHPKEIQKLLDRIDGTPEESMIERLALRSMKQAKYSVFCSGHFGLACKYYCHFTSPIRRYPDLQIHRIIKEQLKGELTEERVSHYREILPDVAQKASELERRADEVERETEKLKKAEYMEGHLGEEYDGIISGVTGWGLYVALENTVEGLVHISRFSDDYYYYLEDTCEIVGEITGRSYKLGMPVRVRVTDCDRAMRTIDFELAGKEGYL